MDISIENVHNIYNTRLTDAEFTKMSNFIYNEYGIKMPYAKKTMLQSRLHKRLRELNIPSFKEYIDYLFSKDGMQNELVHMIDVVSTNKTDFFREPAHFDFLRETMLPQFVSASNANRYLKIWSAGCSTGEEPYTISMVLSDFAASQAGFSFSIFATDISSRALKHAVTAIYTEDRVAQIPMTIKKKYFLKSKDKTNLTVRIIPQLRGKVTFQRLNFMANSYNVYDNFDIIFCRNVLIYFDRQTQESVINKLCKKLKPNGFFFLGHSESITNMNVPLKQIKPTIFRKIGQ